MDYDIFVHVCAVLLKKEMYIYYSLSFICGFFVYSFIHSSWNIYWIPVKARDYAAIKATKMGGQKVTIAAKWRRYCGARQELNQKGYPGAVKEYTVWARTQADQQVFQK